MDAIKVENLTKRYGSFTAVDSISFQVDEGEVFGFLGPNGSGKSTTIRILTGIIKPDGGTAVVMGHDIKKDPIRAKQVMGVVPEMSNAYVELSAWNNLMLMGELYGVPKRESAERAKKLLEQFGLYDRRDSPARGFSKGMKQRLILCMALINQPSVLVLDEPTSGLDVERSRLIKDVIRELNRAGTTVFLTTHNMEDASQLCERIAIINQGVIATIDRPEALKRASSGLQSIELSFNRMVSAEDLSKFSCIKQVKKLGDKFRLYADDVDLTMGCIMDYARSQNLKIVALNTLAPSLEDIFVSLTHKTKPGED